MHYSDAVVSCDWLAEHLTDPNLRIFDCTTFLGPSGDPNRPYSVNSGRPQYEEGHIPGSAYLDLQGDFSRSDSPFGMMLDTVENVAAAFARAGVGDDTRVVLYSRTSLPWATRFWWMLHWLGFDNAAILNGGYTKWVADGHPVSTDAQSYPAAHLTPKPRPDVFVGRQEVQAAIGDSATCTINALGPDVHNGQSNKYGRPGRIPGSINIPAASTFTPETHMLKPLAELAPKFTGEGDDRAKRIIAYCGGGIFATLDAFILNQLGFNNVAVYDASLSEWATDPALPMETG